MQTILEPIINNLVAVGIVFGIYVLAAFCYIVVSTYYNIIDTKEESFDGKKMKQGIVKMVSLGISSALLAIVATLIPQYLLDFAIDLGLDIGADTQSIVTVAAIILMYKNAIISYFKGTMDVIAKILNRDINNINRDSGNDNMPSV